MSWSVVRCDGITCIVDRVEDGSVSTVDGVTSLRSSRSTTLVAVLVAMQPGSKGTCCCPMVPWNHTHIGDRVHCETSDENISEYTGGQWGSRY